MAGTKNSAFLHEVQDAIDLNYPDMGWEARGSLEHDKGCSINDKETGVIILARPKNYDVYMLVRNPDIDLRKKVKSGLKIPIAKTNTLKQQLQPIKRKLITLIKKFMAITGGLRPRIIYNDKNVPIDIQFGQINKEI